MARKKKRFSTNQLVVFRVGNILKLGRVAMVRPIGKKFFYDVLCEDGKIYSELQVDSEIQYCIETYPTRLFYKKYNIDESGIPDLSDDDEPVFKSNVPEIESDTELVEEDQSTSEDEILYEDEELDPNY